MSGLAAVTRPVSASMSECELTHLERTTIDIETAHAQHRAYCAALAESGCSVIELPAADNMPDAVFVEDTAVVLDEIAVVTRPGAESRRREVDAVMRELTSHRPLHRVQAPGTLDGGDVLHVGRTLFVGASGRSNAAGIDQLRYAVSPHGYTVRTVPLRDCLHLKTAVTLVTDDTLVINRAWVDASYFGAARFIDVAKDEPFAANALRIGDQVIYPAAFERTASLLEGAGVNLLRVDVSELARAEGGVTCCSLVFNL